MPTALADTERSVPSYDRRLLEASLSRSQLVRSVELSPSGTLSVSTVDWWDHWRPLVAIGSRQLIEKCTQLRHRWQDYIESGFGDDTAAPYCLAYWSLLEDLVELAASATPSPAPRHAIGATATFESFAVTDNARRGVAAATTTLRNPAYLLARLKWPTVPHTTRFLPLIGLRDTSPSLFGHYRRYPVSEDGDFSLLVYPTNRSGGDRVSMSVIAALANRLGSSSDPFVADRSERLWSHIIQPLLEQCAPQEGVSTFDFVDLGAGTGALTAALGQKLVAWAAREGLDPHLRFSLVDSSGTAPSDRFRDPALKAVTRDLSRIPVDYRAWLTQRQTAPSRHGLRIGLACNVLDMSSVFEIRRFGRSQLSMPPATDAWFDPSARSPARWLTGATSNSDDLLISPARFQIADGHVIAQPALSTYFAALALMSDGTQAGEDLHLPVRRFDQAALITSAGTSGPRRDAQAVRPSDHRRRRPSPRRACRPHAPVQTGGHPGSGHDGSYATSWELRVLRLEPAWRSGARHRRRTAGMSPPELQ